MVLYENFLPESYYNKKRQGKKSIQKSICPRTVKSTSTPWISGTEWKKVYRQLFCSSSSSRAWHDAYTTMVRWSRMTRVNVPTSVVATIHLLRAKNIWRSFHARSPTTSTPDWLHQCFTSPGEQALLYTNLAIVQFVNAFVKEEEHRHDVRGNTVSIGELGSMAGLPECCVVMRNNFVHSSAVGALADENGLRETMVDQLWIWIKMQYWDVELEALNVSERLQEVLQGEIQPPPQLRTNIRQLLQPSQDDDPRESLFVAIDTALRTEAESHDGLISCRKKRVRTVIEEVVQKLLLQEHLHRTIITAKGDQCVCGSRLRMEHASNILNLLCWLLTHVLGSAIHVPPPPSSSLTGPENKSHYKKHINSIIASVLAAKDVADVGYTVADHVLAVLAKRATIGAGLNNFLAKQWLLVLAGNCCPPVAGHFRAAAIKDKRCPHYEMFTRKPTARAYDDDEPSPSEPPWRVFYPLQLPYPTVCWRPLVRTMLDAKDDRLDSLAWRIAECTFPEEETSRLRDRYKHERVPFDGDALDGFNTTRSAAGDSSTPVSGTKEGPEGITVDQLLKAMATGDANHLEQDEDQHNRYCVKNMPCNTGRGALTFNIDTLSDQLIIREPENYHGGTAGSDDTPMTPTGDEQQDTVILSEGEEDDAREDAKLGTKNAMTGDAVLRQKIRHKAVRKLKSPASKKERETHSMTNQSPRCSKNNRNLMNNDAKCEDKVNSSPDSSSSEETEIDWESLCQPALPSTSPTLTTQPIAESFHYSITKKGKVIYKRATSASPPEPGGASPPEPAGASPTEPGGASPPGPGGASPRGAGGADSNKRKLSNVQAQSRANKKSKLTK